MTKDEITKALTTTADTNEPSGLALDWVSDTKLTVTMPSGKKFILKTEVNYFFIVVDGYCNIYGNKIRVEKYESCFIMVHNYGSIVANIFVL
jgi:hypothetical protein